MRSFDVVKPAQRYIDAMNRREMADIALASAHRQHEAREINRLRVTGRQVVSFVRGLQEIIALNEFRTTAAGTVEGAISQPAETAYKIVDINQAVKGE